EKSIIPWCRFHPFAAARRERSRRITLNALRFGWHCNLENCASRRVWTNPYVAIMRIHDQATDRQAKSFAAGLRREERVEHSLEIVAVDACATVGNRDDDADPCALLSM